MKLLHSTLALLCLTTLIAVESAQALTVEYRRVSCPPCDPNGLRWWNPDYIPTSGESPCPVSGRTCIREVIYTIGQDYPPTEVFEYGWAVTAEIPRIGFQEEGGPGYIETPSPGTTFDPNEFVAVITSWSEHPEYVGVSIPLEGLTISSAGTITFFIPY